MSNNRQGFTIIEVGLVLGLAAIIFAMAFIALPSLWASQRDADRKAKVMEFTSDIKTYQTNNSRGALPDISGNMLEFNFGDYGSNIDKNNTWEYLVKNYVKSDFSDANGNPYRFYIVNCLNDNGADNLRTGETCKYPKSGANPFATINQETNIDAKPPVHKVGNQEYALMYVAVGAICDGDHAVKANSTRDVAVIQVLERGGRYCHNT